MQNAVTDYLFSVSPHRKLKRVENIDTRSSSILRGYKVSSAHE